MGSSPRALICVRSAGVSLSDMALRASGRLSVISATPSFTVHKSSVVPVSISMGASLHMTFPVTEHTVKTARHTTGYLACGAEGATAADLLPWLARALAVVAASAAGLRRARLPLHRARHARLRPVQHLRAARGLRAGADRRRHARAARRARPRRTDRGVDRPRLGQPRRLEHRRAPSRQDGRRREPLRAVSAGGLHARHGGAAGRPLGLSRGGVSGRPVGLPVLLRGELRQGAARASRPTSATS